MKMASYIVHLAAKSFPDCTAAQKLRLTSCTPKVDQIPTSRLASESAWSRRALARATSTLAICTLSSACLQLSSQAPNQPRAL
eukprot:CAMPEP_0177301722 /NCGR_PEP_ID=MMETSP0368-20130122/5212_1 /TAXON_ID=447022 ORGANISM="Scrippsiella hangoei-like, Strain SHHI-4" /NCGR_SAMPLE_ID=MMETSP0368 /ASSEMBLY_ACC=CAM_ASM_000363 /LENGTH=82 /DNA_ID=CAMNT_0018760143 /DNA_START=302 /DNA_END=550 /DNA_ORIENTATION=+